ncbi:hypothetical protein CSA08_01460 [Candidatus Gracilibacteria bacterium]|nr:MAG: hypothetical protein CSA08_01460 [Candidatus Gracilibacteria bacterium]
MLDIFNKDNILSIVNTDKKEIAFNTETKEVLLDGLSVGYPGEYEKSGILLEVKEYEGILFYHFVTESKRLVIITSDNFTIKEDILSFFGDVDILIINGTKDSIKIFENIEAKLVIPYGESKDIFLNTLGQHIEQVDNYKVKGEFALDTTEFVNLK